MSPEIKKVLVANRGEIAVRVIRGCQEMGIATVAVFSEADRDALHVRLADESVFIGPAPASESYLVIDKIIAAALAGRADAIHPGYGFLAENAAFSKAVRDAGMTFIGPSPESIRSMGDKVEARALAAKAGVPVVPGYQIDGGGAKLSSAEMIDNLFQASKEVGYPVLIKATAGGGGKGMRVVRDAGAFFDSAQAAMREAAAAFGNPVIYLEKYLDSPRHVEVQVLGDGRGGAVHVGERECSIQRRHQKIVEETPSPVIDDATRARMTGAAVSLASAINYEGAGTVEFLYSGGGDFYFLEMNTRLQVEHPVTEMVYGVDLVREQVGIACGGGVEHLENLQRRGYAVECRIYAEDAFHGFLPQVGRVEMLETPGGNGIRDDSSLYEGAVVSEFYDPLLAKLCCWAENREKALKKMDWALSRYRILGVTTNIDFLRRVVSHPQFIAGEYDTHFLDRHAEDFKTGDEEIPMEALAAAAIFAESGLSSVSGANGDEADHPGPWSSGGGWRQSD